MILAANMLAIVDSGVSTVAEPLTSSLTSRDTSKEEKGAIVTSSLELVGARGCRCR
jgi:hypothetical protein